MFIQENNTLQDENISMLDLSEIESSLSKIIDPEDIPIIEAYDEQNFNFADGMFHIEDL